MFLRNLLLLLLIVLVARALWRLFGGIVQGASGGTGASTRRASPPAMKMMRDPVCGTYVVPGKALEVARGRETIYFCSEECRDRFAANR
ncbi:MAG: hypothetical protein ACT4QD_17060 [Acidobacteriota bacterium]